MKVVDKLIDSFKSGATMDIINPLLQDALSSSETSEDDLNKILVALRAYGYINLTIIKNVIDAFAEREILLSFGDSILSLMDYLDVETDYNLKGYLLVLVTDDSGLKRFLGRQLWCKFHPDIDLLKESEETQLRFVVSIVQSYCDAKAIVLPLLTLFNSKYPNVRKILCYVLYDFTLNYCGLVKETLQQMSLMDSDELKIFMNFMSQCEERFNLYHHCVELHSEYFYPEIFDLMKKEEKKEMETQMRVYEEKNPPFYRQLFKPVALARGGGFRKTDGSVQPLGKISVSTIAPMMLSSKTPLEQHMELEKMLEDWDKINTENE